MNNAYDPEFDSPEARANFATRHIFHPGERRRRRDELLRQFAEQTVVPLRPGETVVPDRRVPEASADDTHGSDLTTKT